jgi:hypothetical protein
VVRGLTAALDSQIIALKDLTAGTYHVLVRARAPLFTTRRYDLRIQAGYRSSAPPDVQEDDDHCAKAVEFVRVGGLDYDLTIDNPGDVEWFRFSLTVPKSVSFATVLCGCLGETGLAYFPLLEILTDSAQARQVAGGVLVGGLAPSFVTADLPAGNYLLAVSDVTGETGLYQVGSDLPPPSHRASAQTRSTDGDRRKQPRR